MLNLIQRHARIFASFTVLFWLGIILFLWNSGWKRLQIWELGSYNFRFEWRGPIPADPRLVLVAIDEQSIVGDSVDEELFQENPDLKLLRNYPFPRRVYAIAIERLIQAGAKVVGIDVILANRSPLCEGTEADQDDESLREVLTKYHDQVVIAAEYPLTGSNENHKENRGKMPNQRVLPLDPNLRKSLVGNVWINRDIDDQKRRMFRYHSSSPSTIQQTPPLFIYQVLKKSLFPFIEAKKNNDEALMINYVGPQKTFPHYPLVEIFTTSDLRNVFNNKVVLIGPTARFLQDLHSTPFCNAKNRSMPGSEIHLNALATLLNHREIHITQKKHAWVILSGAGVILGTIFFIFRSPLTKFIAGTLLSTFYAFLAQWVFEGQYLLIPLVPVELLVTLSTIYVVTVQGVAEQLNKVRANQLLQRYVSKDIANELIHSTETLEEAARPKRKLVTTLISDIRSFSTAVDSSNLDVFIPQYNKYLKEMTICVFNNSGSLDKFVGDAVVAHYGNIKSYGEQTDALNAIRTALAMREKLRELNQQWEREGKFCFHIGVGINCGECAVSLYGSELRAEYGVIGTPVNIAARVESLTKDEGVDILITESVYTLVRECIDVSCRGERHVKGIAKPIVIYALLGMK